MLRKTISYWKGLELLFSGTGKAEVVDRFSSDVHTTQYVPTLDVPLIEAWAAFLN